MPITAKDEGTYVEYSIPTEIMEQIPDYFYTAFAGELFSISGWERSREMFYPEKDDGYTDLASSTSGWVQAFKTTCRKLEMEWLLKYYETLPWYDSDVFDGIIEHEIARRFMNRKDERCNDYYRYLLSWEQNRESKDEI